MKYAGVGQPSLLSLPRGAVVVDLGLAAIAVPRSEAEDVPGAVSLASSQRPPANSSRL